MNEKDVKNGKRRCPWAHVGQTLRVVAVNEDGSIIVELFDGRMNAVTKKVEEVKR